MVASIFLSARRRDQIPYANNTARRALRVTDSASQHLSAVAPLVLQFNETELA